MATVVAALLVAATIWYFASPAWTLSRMKAAVEARDAVALDAYIDYPALREDLTAKLVARLRSKAQDEKSGLAGLGAAVGALVAEPLIDTLLTPEGVRAALLEGGGRPAGSPVTTVLPGLPVNPVIERRGLSAFIVTSNDQPGTGLVFRLHGLSSKLSGVELRSKSEQ